MNIPSARTIAFRPNERNVFLHILTACNLACQHCYINREQHGSEMISRETMASWLKIFHDPDKETNLIFLGGEPTMHPDLAWGIKKAREIGYGSITVDTNGYLFNDLLENISPDDAVISFSLDGPDPEINDPIRGEGVYETCTTNLKKAVGMGFRTSLIYTVSRMNLEHLKRMPELLADWGVSRFFIQVIGLRGRSAEKGKELQLNPDEWLAAVPPVAAAAATLGIPTTFPRVFLDEGEKFECAGRVALGHVMSEMSISRFVGPGSITANASSISGRHISNLGSALRGESSLPYTRYGFVLISHVTTRLSMTV